MRMVEACLEVSYGNEDGAAAHCEAEEPQFRGERTRGVTSGARQEFCRNFFTMAKIGHRQFGVRNSPLLQLILCYYLLSRVETLGWHRRGYGLCQPRVWSPQVLTRWRFSCKRH